VNIEFWIRESNIILLYHLANFRIWLCYIMDFKKDLKQILYLFSNHDLHFSSFSGVARDEAWMAE
jgi:hypothetical protein